VLDKNEVKHEDFIAYISSSDENDQIQLKSLNACEGLDRRYGKGCFPEHLETLH
jgi:hypothetical protein